MSGSSLHSSPVLFPRSIRIFFKVSCSQVLYSLESIPSKLLTLPVHPVIEVDSFSSAAKDHQTLNMSSQAPYAAPASSPTPHGGDMDPNEVRLRQARAQDASGSSTQHTNSLNVAATADRPHGGDMDPNEVRLRRAHMEQPSGSSSPAANSPAPNDNIIVQGGVQNSYQNSQSPMSVRSGQYFPTQPGYQPLYQQQSPQIPQYGSPAQVGYH